MISTKHATSHLTRVYGLAFVSGGGGDDGGGAAGEKAAKPVTAAHDCVSINL